MGELSGLKALTSESLRRMCYGTTHTHTHTHIHTYIHTTRRGKTHVNIFALLTSTRGVMVSARYKTLTVLNINRTVGGDEACDCLGLVVMRHLSARRTRQPRQGQSTKRAPVLHGEE